MIPSDLLSDRAHVGDRYSEPVTAGDSKPRQSLEIGPVRSRAEKA
jgi:hypothetical protein